MAAPAWSDEERRRRLHGASSDDQRDQFERDRDRVLYSSAFRRLAGITQVVRAGEADVFHTRQQHTLKVAQVGRRLAQQCVRNQPDASSKLGVDPEVVEAACLAHDLGHPPFGHVGEHILHEHVLKHGDLDGFEGNAQTFRIITKLSVRFVDVQGLDLTRASLAATVKYPWMRDPADPAKSKKWGAYRTEEQEFNFARESFIHEAKTPEAALMDWADDIAYSVHDLEDFHRCGALPWHRIFSDEGKKQLVSRATQAWFAAPQDAEARLSLAVGNLYNLFLGVSEELFSAPYEGLRSQRQQLRTLTSKLIARYITAAKLKAPDEIGGDGSSVVIEDEMADEVKVLKQITRDYIIENSTLAAQQKGQEKILTELYESISEDARIGPPRYIPRRLVYLWDAKTTSPARFVADCISSLTEAEVVALHGRLMGTSSGSVLDPIVR